MNLLENLDGRGGEVRIFALHKRWAWELRVHRRVLHVLDSSVWKVINRDRLMTVNAQWLSQEGDTGVYTGTELRIR